MKVELSKGDLINMVLGIPVPLKLTMHPYVLGAMLGRPYPSWVWRQNAYVEDFYTEELIYKIYLMLKTGIDNTGACYEQPR